MGTLFVVPTPIGNLEDITVRALRVLREVDVVLAEDTRHTKKLFQRYDITTRLMSYHQHNKLVRLPEILALLAEHDVALVSNAGMPAIADPGFELIAEAHQSKVNVDVLPGANAAVTALVAASLPSSGFAFLGFLPRRRAERRERLKALSDLSLTLVFYEAPHRVLPALQDIALVLGDRSMVVCRELTKLHQEVVQGTVQSSAEHFSRTVPRGEFTLVVAGAAAAAPATETDAAAELRRRRQSGEDRRTAVAAVAAHSGLRRNALYRLWLDAEDRGGGDITPGR